MLYLAFSFSQKRYTLSALAQVYSSAERNSTSLNCPPKTRIKEKWPWREDEFSILLDPKGENSYSVAVDEVGPVISFRQSRCRSNTRTSAPHGTGREEQGGALKRCIPKTRGVPRR